jgi:hypothetical protein
MATSMLLLLFASACCADFLAAGAFVHVAGPTSTGGTAPGPATLDWVWSAVEFNAASYNQTLASGPGSWGQTLPVCGDVYYCYDDDDVAAAMSAALQAGATRLQARSGSHSYVASAATTFGAAVIDVSNLTFIELGGKVPCHDDAAGTAECTEVHVGPGVRLFHLYHRLAEAGLFFPGGTCPTVAVGGFVLGGGYGPWSRMAGLGSDNILQITVHTAVGRRVVNATSDPDLFKALRGGGNNNFGIVTNFTLRALPKPAVVSSWRLNIASTSACISQAVPLFQRSATFDWVSASGNPPIPRSVYRTNAQPVSITIDMYKNGCAADIVGVNLTAAVLKAALATAGWLGIATTTPNPADGPAEDEWLLGVLRTEGCASVAACEARVRSEYPNPFRPGRWLAMSAYQFLPMDVVSTTAFVDGIRGGSVHNDGTFVVSIMDMYGGAINNTLLNDATAFAHHEALYHVQSLAYLPDGNATKYDNAASWSLGVLGSMDLAVARSNAGFNASYLPAAYRNYPSPFLPDANERYFGPRLLKFLLLVKQRVDPNNTFGYAQGVTGM